MNSLNNNIAFRVFALVFLFSVMGIIFLIVKPTNEKNEKLEAEQAYNIREIMEVPITTLIQEYENNELNGEKLYKDKWIKTTVYFESVHRSYIDSSVSVYFNTSEDKGLFKTDVRCDNMTETQEEKITEFNKGDEITIVGVNDGLLSSSTMSFDNCEFIDY